MTSLALVSGRAPLLRANRVLPLVLSVVIALLVAAPLVKILLATLTPARLYPAHVDPVEAMRRLAELTFDHHLDHQAFIRLVSIENIHRGEFIGQLDSLRTISQPATTLLDEILTRGRDSGVFRRDVDALDVHIVISSYCVFQVANRHTFGFLFGVDFTELSQRAHLRRMIGDVVVGWLTTH